MKKLFAENKARILRSGAGLGLYAVCALTASVLAAVALRLWDAHFGVPFAYSLDSLPHSMHAQQLDQNLWYFKESRLGAPFGQHFQDWPLPDIAHLLLLKVLGLFTDNWAVAFNAAFLLGFPLAAITALWTFLRFGIKRPFAFVLAVLFAVLPYHFVRGEIHMFLSLYYAVPLAVWLVAEIAQGRSVFTGRNWPTVRNFAFCLLIAWSGIYYAIFTLVLLAIAVAIQVLDKRSFRVVTQGASVCIAIGLLVTVALSPSLMSSMSNGSNAAASERVPWESDLYGLKIAQLYMPVHGHVIEPLRQMESDYYRDFPLPSEASSSALGVVGAVGLSYLLVLLIAVGMRIRRANLWPETMFASLTLPIILLASVGGLSTFVGLFLTTSIRSWNRISIFIAVFALAAVGFGLGRVSDRLRWKFSAVALSAVVLCVGVGDQVLANWRPQYEQIASTFNSDQAFVSSIEAEMPEGSAIYQLPRMDFPEAVPVKQVASYDNLRPYLHSENLRWSFGGVKGRLESEWQVRLANPQDQLFPQQLVAAGFDGLYIDRRGINQGVEDRIRNNIAAVGKENASGDLVFYDLRPFSQRMDTQQKVLLARDLLFRAIPVRSSDFGGTEYSDDGFGWTSRDTQGEFYIDNSASVPLLSRVELKVEAPNGTPFEVRWPGGEVDRFDGASVPVVMSKTINLSPGRSSVFVKLLGDDNEATFKVLNPDVSPG